MTLYKESPSDILALYDNIAYAKGIPFDCSATGDNLQFYFIRRIDFANVL